MLATKKVSAKEIQSIGSRMYETAMRQHDKRKAIYQNRRKTQEDQPKYSWKPDISKKRFVKYPNPVRLPNSKTVFFDKPGTQPIISQIDKINKEKNKEPIKKVAPNSKMNPLNPQVKAAVRVNRLYNWQSNRTIKLKQEFFKEELGRSCEIKQLARSREISRSRIINSSLENIHIKGSEEFLLRQQKAAILKREKNYLAKFPSSYIWSYKEKFESSMDTVPTHYLDFGDSRISR